jgi:hypothetical protein
MAGIPKRITRLRVKPFSEPSNVVCFERERCAALYRRGMDGDVEACIEWLDRYYFGNRLSPAPWDDAPDETRRKLR